MKNKVLPMGKKSLVHWTPEQKHNYLVKAFYIVLILLCSLLQNTALFPTIFGAHAWLLVAAVVSISMFERDYKSSLYGLFAGALWDVYSAWGDGFHAISLFLIANVICWLMNNLMRNNLVTSLLLGGVSVFLYSLMHWLIFVVLRGTGGAGFELVKYYLPTFAYTLALVPVFYILVRACLVAIRNKYPKPVKTNRYE